MYNGYSIPLVPRKLCAVCVAPPWQPSVLGQVFPFNWRPCSNFTLNKVNNDIT